MFRPVIASRLRPSCGLGLLNSDLSLSLGYVLRAMTEHGCELEVPVRVRGEEAIPSAGAIFVGGHLYLSIAAVRFLCDRGVPVSLVRPAPDEHRLLGTRRPLPIIASDKSIFVRIRNTVRAGGSVAVLVDDASTGEVTIRPQTIELALRAQMPIVFFGANLAEDGAIEAVFERPRGRDTAEISRQLLAFLFRLAPR